MRGQSGNFLAVDESPEPYSGWPPLGLLFGDSMCVAPLFLLQPQMMTG